MTDKAILNQRSIAHSEEPYRRFEEAIRKANRGIFNDGVIIDPTQTNVGDTTVHDSIVKHSSYPRGPDQVPTGVDASPVIDTGSNIDNGYMDIQTDRRTRLDVSSHPDDLGSVATVSNIIVDGGNMRFIGHDSEATADLVTLMLEAVSGELRSLLSEMLPTMSAPEAVPAPHFRSAAAPSPTTISAFPLVHSDTPRTSKHFGGPSSTFQGSGSVTVTTGLFRTHAHQLGSILVAFLKNALASIRTAKPANRGSRTMTPPLWSGRPMAFASYERPHGRGGLGCHSEFEKRRHYPVR
jgi:hypothetical protein